MILIWKRLLYRYLQHLDLTHPTSSVSSLKQLELISHTLSSLKASSHRYQHPPLHQPYNHFSWSHARFMPLPSIWLIVLSVLFSLHSVNETSASNFAIFSFSSKATVSIDVPPHKFSEELNFLTLKNKIIFLNFYQTTSLNFSWHAPPTPFQLGRLKISEKHLLRGSEFFILVGDFVGGSQNFKGKSEVA